MALSLIVGFVNGVLTFLKEFIAFLGISDTREMGAVSETHP